MGAEVSYPATTCSRPQVVVDKDIARSRSGTENDVDWDTPTSSPLAETASPPPSPVGLVVTPRNEAEAVIIFDWDDTLLCSTSLQVTEVPVKQLQELARAAQSALETAMGLGEVLIVTNGNGTWIHDSACRFMPSLLPTLAKLRCLSARALYEHKYPGDPYMWKQVCFKRLLTEERCIPAQPGLNLVALGDQQPEIDAAWNVARLVGGDSLVKTIKFKEAPTLGEIIGQLRRVEDDLLNIVGEAKSSACSLSRRPMPLQWDNLASHANGWKRTVEDEHAWGLSDVVSVKDLWKHMF